MDKIATEEAVWQVCDQIVAEGRKVSGRSVKKELGGSTSTIYPYIDSWRARDEKSHVVCQIPVDVQKTILLALGQSAKKATETLTVKIEEAAEREKEITEELIKSEQKIATLENDLSVAQAQFISLTQMQERESAVAAETIVGLREQIVKLDQEKDELVLSRETAKTEVVKILSQLERADQATEKAEESLLEMAQQVSVLTKATTEAEKANAVAERHTLDLSGQIAKLDEQLKINGAVTVRLESEKTALTIELKGAMSTSRKAEGVAEQMEFRIQDCTAANGQLRKDLEAIRTESALLAEQNALRMHEGEMTINQLRKELELVRMRQPKSSTVKHNDQ